MSLVSEFRAATSRAARSNPDDDGRSEPLRFLYWLAAERERARSSARMNPAIPPSEKASTGAVDFDDIYLAGQDLGFDGDELEAFVENWASWV